MPAVTDKLVLELPEPEQETQAVTVMEAAMVVTMTAAELVAQSWLPCSLQLMWQQGSSWLWQQRGEI